MSDLISRKVVMDWLRGVQAQNIINQHNGTLVDATINSFIDFVVQVPTAFDADKVVEQLEELSYEYEFLQPLSAPKIIERKMMITTERAISAVKGAVKDE